jgi:hypothetical protein
MPCLDGLKASQPVMILMLLFVKAWMNLTVLLRTNATIQIIVVMNLTVQRTRSWVEFPSFSLVIARNRASMDKVVDPMLSSDFLDDWS